MLLSSQSLRLPDSSTNLEKKSLAHDKKFISGQKKENILLVTVHRRCNRSKQEGRAVADVVLNSLSSSHECFFELETAVSPPEK